MYWDRGGCPCLDGDKARLREIGKRLGTSLDSSSCDFGAPKGRLIG